MAENSGISWTDHTFNPWMGCTKVSPACKNCYAERDMDHRYGRVSWGPMGTRVLTSPENWKKPLRWNREAEKNGVRYRVFCASLADVFEDWGGKVDNHKGNQLFINADDGWTENACGRAVTLDDVRKELFSIIDSTPHLDWLLLTKRPENIERMWPYAGVATIDGLKAPASVGLGHFRPNVWLGTTIESQEWAEKRIPHLLNCGDMAKVLFLSCEPMTGPINLNIINVGDVQSIDALNGVRSFAGIGGSPGRQMSCANIDWVIAGGESGPEARPHHPDWFRTLRDQCQAAGVPFHFKQWGEWLPLSQAEKIPDFDIAGTDWSHNLGDDDDMAKVGVKKAGRLLDGVLHDAFPCGVS